MSKRIKLTEEGARILENMLGHFVAETTGVYAALVSSSDGHALAQWSQSELHGSKLSAMSSSLLALGESLSRESGQQACQYVIVETLDGFLVDLRVGERMVLTVLARKDGSLGLLLSACHQLAQELSSRIRKE